MSTCPHPPEFIVPPWWATKRYLNAVPNPNTMTLCAAKSLPKLIRMGFCASYTVCSINCCTYYTFSMSSIQIHFTQYYRIQTGWNKQQHISPRQEKSRKKTSKVRNAHISKHKQRQWLQMTASLQWTETKCWNKDAVAVSTQISDNASLWLATAHTI